MGHKNKKNIFLRLISVWVILAFLSLSIPSQYVYAQSVVLQLPKPGVMVHTSSAYVPALIKGITIHPQNPLKFDFIIDTGDSSVKDESLKAETNKLIKYFLASLTVPEKDMWVNLSPYEENRIIPEGFGDTEMGRDLLAQDYLLKQVTSSLIYPEDELGKKFWDEIYSKAYEKYNSTDIPIDTLNKVWIVPERAAVYEQDQSVYVIDSYLKVLMEQDYAAMQHNLGEEPLVNSEEQEFVIPAEAGIQGNGSPIKTFGDDREAASVSTMREVILPAIEKEVNQGKHFANLRQIYNAMIFAAWFKQSLKQSLLGQVYVDQQKTVGVDTQDKQINDKIYDQYLDAFKQGVFNYIKEEYDPAKEQVIPRKYFSGGAALRTAEVLSRFDRSMFGAPEVTRGLAHNSPRSSIHSARVNLLELTPNTKSNLFAINALANEVDKSMLVQEVANINVPLEEPYRIRVLRMDDGTYVSEYVFRTDAGQERFFLKGRHEGIYLLAEYDDGGGRLEIVVRPKEDSEEEEINEKIVNVEYHPGRNEVTLVDESEVTLDEKLMWNEETNNSKDYVAGWDSFWVKANVAPNLDETIQVSVLNLKRRRTITQYSFEESGIILYFEGEHLAHEEVWQNPRQRRKQETKIIKFKLDIGSQFVSASATIEVNLKNGWVNKDNIVVEDVKRYTYEEMLALTGKYVEEEKSHGTATQRFSLQESAEPGELKEKKWPRSRVMEQRESNVFMGISDELFDKGWTPQSFSKALETLGAPEHQELKDLLLRELAEFAVDETELMSEEMRGVLRRVFTWRHVWRVDVQLGKGTKLSLKFVWDFLKSLEEHSDLNSGDCVYVLMKAIEKFPQLSSKDALAKIQKSFPNGVEDKNDSTVVGDDSAMLVAEVLDINVPLEEPYRIRVLRMDDGTYVSEYTFKTDNGQQKFFLKGKHKYIDLFYENEGGNAKYQIGLEADDLMPIGFGVEPSVILEVDPSENKVDIEDFGKVKVEEGLHWSEEAIDKKNRLEMWDSFAVEEGNLSPFLDERIETTIFKFNPGQYVTQYYFKKSGQVLYLEGKHFRHKEIGHNRLQENRIIQLLTNDPDKAYGTKTLAMIEMDSDDVVDGDNIVVSNGQRFDYEHMLGLTGEYRYIEEVAPDVDPQSDALGENADSEQLEERKWPYSRLNKKKEATVLVENISAELIRNNWTPRGFSNALETLGTSQEEENKALKEFLLRELAEIDVNEDELMTKEMKDVLRRLFTWKYVWDVADRGKEYANEKLSFKLVWDVFESLEEHSILDSHSCMLALLQAIEDNPQLSSKDAVAKMQMEFFITNLRKHPEIKKLIEDLKRQREGDGEPQGTAQELIDMSDYQQEPAVFGIELDKEITEVATDEAMYGGIDLNSDQLDLQIKRDSSGVALPLPQQPIEQMNIEGFLPVIINITPLDTLPLFS
ncbi:MAG: hypothetical protein GY861_11645 [bacterium]|nr:hypothetical protein [bacterium]